MPAHPAWDGAVGVGDPPQVVLRRRRRSDLAPVVGLNRTGRGVVVEQEPAAPDTGGLGLNQTEHRLGGDESVRRGAAVAKHSAGRLGGQRVGGDHRVATCSHRRHVLAVAGGDLGRRDVPGCGPAPVGGAEVLGAGVPFSMIEQGPAAADGALSSAAHPPSNKTTPASGAATLTRDEIRTTRR